MSFDIEQIPNNLDGGAEHNVCEMFFVPCLSVCKLYRRTAAEITTGAISNWGRAMLNIIENDVPIQFLIGNNSEDFPLIKKVNDLIDNPEAMEIELKKFAMKKFLYCLEGAKSHEHVTNVVRGLFASGQLEMKAVFHKNMEGKIKTHHQKFGYFDMGGSPSIIFNGGGNESHNAYLESGENLTVRKENDPRHTEDYNFWKQKLDDLWDEKPNPNKIVITPDREFMQVINNSVRHGTKDQLRAEWQKYLDKSKTNPAPTAPPKTPKIQLRDYQFEAIKTWFDNDCRGTLEHATGSGKTFTALNAMLESYKRNKCFCVIGVPYIPLGEQWTDEIAEFLNSQNVGFNIVECWHENKDWLQKARHELLSRKRSLQREQDHLTIFVVVNKSLEKFQKLYENRHFEESECLFIGDECHKYASLLLLTQLPKAKFRLGLSATLLVDQENPREKEIAMMNYFGGEKPIHTFSLEDAIPDYLCNYNYFPVKTHLSDEEFDAWNSLFKMTGWTEDSSDNELYEDDGLGAIYGKMAKILGSAENKMEVLKDLLPTSEEEKRFSLIFCGQGKDENKVRDIEKVADILGKKGWNPSRITSDEDRLERKEIIKQFKSGICQGLLAIKILDEGIDIPEIKNAYIVASSTNRRQFIQRRGRVLRKLKGREKVANIYDLIVIPPQNQSIGAERIIQNELKRIKQMSQKALNKKESDDFIEKYEKMYLNQ